MSDGTHHDWLAIFAHAKEHGLSPKQVAQANGVSVTAIYNRLSVMGISLPDGRKARGRGLMAARHAPDAVQRRQSAQQSEAARLKWEKRAANRAPDLPGEEWRLCPSWPGYEASSDGRVRSAYVVLRGTIGPQGYPLAAPSIGGVQKPAKVHHMVMDAFFGPRPPGMDTRHIDGNRANARPENLEWGTRAENQQDRVRHGTSNHGSRNGNVKITAEQAVVIYRRAIAGENQRIIGEEYGIDQATVAAIKAGSTWAHVTGAPKPAARVRRRGPCGSTTVRLLP